MLFCQHLLQSFLKPGYKKSDGFALVVSDGVTSVLVVSGGVTSVLVVSNGVTSVLVGESDCKIVFISCKLVGLRL